MGIARITRNAILTNIIATGRAYDPADTFVGVFVQITDNGLDTVLADLTLGTGDLLTRTAVTAWGTPYDLTDGRRVVDGPAIEFRPADETEGTVVRGWYFANASSAGDVLAWGLFPAPVTLVDENSAVTVIPRLTVDPDGRWDAAVVFNG